MAAISASETLMALGYSFSSRQHCTSRPLSVVGRSDQLDDDLATDQRLAAPVFCDEGEEPMLDTVPLAGAGRVMGDSDGETGFIGEGLSSRFHKRTRAPLLPPQSAVIRRLVAPR
jgi:hypothetical protein